MDAPTCTVEDAVEGIERASFTDDNGRRIVHSFSIGGPMMLGADWDTDNAVARIRACDPTTIGWAFAWGKMVLTFKEDRGGDIFVYMFDGVHPRPDATIEGHPDVLLSDLVANIDLIEYGDANTIDGVADAIRKRQGRLDTVRSEG